MFESLADNLRGGVPDRLAQMLDSDPRDTRRAMEVSLPALIGGLRDKTREDGGAEDLLGLLRSDEVVRPDAVDAFIDSGDARTGASILDSVFGERGEGALTSLSKASGLSTRLLARVMSMLAPIATGWLSEKSTEESFDAAQLGTYLEGEADDLDEKGYGKVLALLGGAGATTAAVQAITGTSKAVDVDASKSTDATDAPVADVKAPAGAAKATPAEAKAKKADAVDPKIEKTAKTANIDKTDATPKVTAPDASAKAPNIRIGDEAKVKAGAPAATAGVAMSDELVEVDAGELPKLDSQIDMGGDKPSGASSWLWWAVAGIALLALLGLVLNQCLGGDDTTDETTQTEVATAVPNESIDPVPVEQELSPPVDQAALDQALSIYSGVTGRVENNTIILEGTVAEQGIAVGAVEAANGVANGALVDSRIQVNAPFTLATIIETNSGNFASLELLLAEAQLTGALQGNGPFTIFAPVNFAFDGMTDLEELRADPARLSELLRYHVVQGSYTQDQLRSLDVLPTLFEGESIKVSTDADGNVLLNDLVALAQPDNAADNGILHTVTSVLRPTSEGGITGPSELGEALELEPITFELGSSVIAAESEAELDQVVDYLLANPTNIEIGGHTDSDGAADFNQTLSEERADAVRQYLINNGVPADSIDAVGYGQSKPIAPNDTDDNKALNRRIEFVLEQG